VTGVILGIDHIGLATDDPAGVEAFLTALGMQQTDHGIAAAYGVACQFWQHSAGCGRPAIEVVAPVVAGSPVEGRLARTGPGLYHIAFEVDDIDAELARLRRSGFVAVDPQPRAGARADMQVAFMYGRKPAGLLIELVRYQRRPDGHGAAARWAAAPSEAELRAAVARELPGVRAELERLVRIPGIAFDSYDHSQLERSAEAVASLLAGCGLEVTVVRAGGQPAVIGRRPAPPGAPTVLLYAHHDVQPAGDLGQWDSDPFEPVERDGRLYGRGAADDKAGLMAHVAALRAFGDALPVGVVVFVEGEEEYGSTSLDEILRRHRDELTADVIVIADSGNWDVGVPAITTSLRGIVNCFVEVRVLHSAVHSGFGGAVPDALTVLARLLATLHDEAGDVAVAGLAAREAAPLEFSAERLRAEAAMVDGVQLIGTGRLVDRMWTRPAVSVLGIDAPRTGEAGNALVPAAKAKVSIRLAAGDRPQTAYAAVKAHLEAHVPWGAQVTVSYEGGGSPFTVDATGPVYEAARAAFRAAWDGVGPVDIGLGGTIPFIGTFQQAFPDAAILVTGVEDPHTHAHGPNESLHLGEFARVCLAEALLLGNLAKLAGGPDPAGGPALPHASDPLDDRAQHGHVRALDGDVGEAVSLPVVD
jgi:methylmalonyl-CoA epimerase